MSVEILAKNIRAIQSLYPQADSTPSRVNVEQLKGLPLWVKGSVELYEQSLHGALSAPLYILLPTREMPFEQLQRVYKFIAESLPGHILLIADLLPAKYRPLLVKFRLPFIYKDESIFAPDLGIKFGKLKKFTAPQTVEVKTARNKISPFALKIIGGILTKQIPHEFTLKSLFENITAKGVKLSLSKLSLTLNHLSSHEILASQGAGPKKKYFTEEFDTIWRKSQEASFAPLFREVHVSNMGYQGAKYRLAGESALASYSNLATPTIEIIAVSTTQFRLLHDEARKNPKASYPNMSVTVQIWREDPLLFSVEESLNPIEVYFSLRYDPDERIQIALGEMLETYNLSKGSY